MSAMFVYSIIVGVTLAILYLTVKLLLVNSTFFRFNRFVILMCYIVALLSPLLINEWKSLSLTTDNAIGMIDVDSPTAIAIIAEPTATQVSNPIIVILIIAYISGVILFAARAIYLLTRMMLMIRRCRKVKHNNCNWTVCLHNDNNISPFSWGRYIVMSEGDYADSCEIIIRHEEMHLSRNHWIDLLFAEAVAVITWYNPAAWLMQRELQSVHEYEADNAVLTSGFNAKEYQILLIKKAVGSRFPSIANSLDHSNLSKRIKMMLRKKSSPAQRWLAIATIPAVALSALVLMSPAVASALTVVSETKVTNYETTEQTISPKNAVSSVVKSVESTAATEISAPIKVASTVAPSSQSNTSQVKAAKSTPAASTAKVQSEESATDNVFNTVEVMPQFPGGEGAMMQFLAANMKYPKEAMDKKIQGRVILKFVITSTGKVGDITVVRGVDPLLNDEAVRIVKLLPDFTPGMIDGKPVSVWYVLPISFKLQDENTINTITIGA